MDKLTIDQAADIATSTLAKGLFIKDSYEQHEYLEGHHKGFKAGAEWQKEQDKYLVKQLLDLQINILNKVTDMQWPIIEEIKQHFNL